MRAVLAIGMAACLFGACTQDRPVEGEPVSEETQDVHERRDWTLWEFNGQPVELPEWESGRRGLILAWQDGSIIDFRAGCGFSVSTHTDTPIIRGASPESRRCHQDDLVMLDRVQALFEQGAEIETTESRMTITGSDGSSAVFYIQPHMIF